MGGFNSKFIMSNREREWTEFQEIVRKHVNTYTVPQYGDAPNDQMSGFSVPTIVENIRRYINRSGKNSRGPEEELRDMVKIAHYACAAYYKLKGEYPWEK